MLTERIDNPLISIVVPMWNVEKYIHECIVSILEQSYTNLEVLLINDGSPDHCGRIAELYAGRDARIRVIHQRNGGLSAARNNGTAIAKGLYITYVDGDDFLDRDYVLYLWNLMKSSNAQMSVCPIFSARHSSRKRKKDKCVILNREQALQQLLYQKSFDTSACAKLYRIEDARSILFPEGKLYEDLATVYLRIWSVEQIAVGKRPFYHYRMRPSSITQTHFYPKRLDEIEAIDRLMCFVEEHCPNLVPAAICRKFSCYCQVFLSMPSEREAYKEEKQKLWLFIKGNRWLVFKNLRARNKNRCAALLTLLGPDVFRTVWVRMCK